MKYFFLNLKKSFKILPFALIIAVILFGGLSVAFNTLVSMEENSAENKKFYIGIAGEENDSILNMGISIVQNLDSSRFAIEIKRLNEQQAENELKNGRLSAYAVIPDGFMKAAINGDIKTIKLVTNPKSLGLVSMFKEEITKVVSDILSCSMQGAYGLNDALKENYPQKAYVEMNKLCIKYTEYILKKSNMYSIDELGVADKLTFPQYMFCGIALIFICLCLIPFARLYIKNDNALIKLLYSRRCSSVKQILCEYSSLFLAVLAIFFAIPAILLLSTKIIDSEYILNYIEQINLGAFSLHIVAVLFAVTSMAFAVFELSQSLIGGLLTYFFASLALCYVSGCIYPIYSLPITLQKISEFLPTGIARSYLAFGITGESDYLGLLALLAYGVAFLTVCVAVRHLKISAKGANL